MSTAANHGQPEPGDAEFVERLASHYAPPPLSPGQRAAWHTALEARLEKRRRRRTLFVPGLATATLAAAALVFSLGGRFGLGPSVSPVRPAPGVSTEAPRAAAESLESGHLDDWEYYLLAFQPADSEEEEQHDLLPDDYVAIESVFLEG